MRLVNNTGEVRGTVVAALYILEKMGIDLEQVSDHQFTMILGNLSQVRAYAEEAWTPQLIDFIAEPIDPSPVDFQWLAGNDDYQVLNTVLDELFNAKGAA